MSDQQQWPPPSEPTGTPGGGTQPGAANPYGQPYPTYPGASYPGAGYPAGTPGQPAGTPTRPPAMDRAVLLLRLGALLTVVSSIVTFGGDSFDRAMTNAMEDSGETLTQADRDMIHTVGNVAVVIAIVIGAGLWLWMAWANGRGRKWARVTATVFAVISGVSYLLSVATSFAASSDTDVQTSGFESGVGLVVGTASLAVGLYALWLMYRPESTAFYEAVSNPAPAYHPYYAYPYYGYPYAQPGAEGQPPAAYPYPYAYPYDASGQQAPPGQQAEPPTDQPPAPPPAEPPVDQPPQDR